MTSRDRLLIERFLRIAEEVLRGAHPDRLDTVRWLRSLLNNDDIREKIK